MFLFAIAAGVVLSLIVALREMQLAHQRRTAAISLDLLRHALENTRLSLRRTHEDLFVLRALLLERGVVDLASLALGRTKLTQPLAPMAPPKPALPSFPQEGGTTAPAPDEADVTLH